MQVVETLEPTAVKGLVRARTVSGGARDVDRRYSGQTFVRSSHAEMDPDTGRIRIREGLVKEFGDKLTDDQLHSLARLGVNVRPAVRRTRVAIDVGCCAEPLPCPRR